MIRLKNILTENRLIKRIRQENPNIDFVDDYSIAKTRGSGMVKVGASPSLVYIITMEDVPAQSRDLKMGGFSWHTKSGGPGGLPALQTKQGIAKITITPAGKYHIKLGPSYVPQVSKYISGLAPNTEAMTPTELIKKLSDVRSLNNALRVPPAPAITKQTADITVQDGNIQVIMKPWSAPSGTYQLKQPAIAFALRAAVPISNRIRLQSLDLDTGDAVLSVYKGNDGNVGDDILAGMDKKAVKIKTEAVQTIIENMAKIYAECAQKNCDASRKAFIIEAGKNKLKFTPIFYRNNTPTRVSD